MNLLKNSINSIKKYNNFNIYNCLIKKGLDIEKIKLLYYKFKIGKIIKINYFYFNNKYKIYKLLLINYNKLNYIIYIISDFLDFNLGNKIIFLYNNYNIKEYFFLKKNIFFIKKYDILKKFSFKKKIIFKILPNRIDCLSLFGINKEISLLTNNNFKYIFFEEKCSIKKILYINIDENIKGRFVNRFIKNVNFNIFNIPLFIKLKLKIAGYKLYDNLTNIINFIELELGIYCNIIDLDKVIGKLYIKNNKIEENKLEYIILKDEKNIIIFKNKINNKYLPSINTKNLLIFISDIYCIKKYHENNYEYNIWYKNDLNKFKQSNNINIILALKYITKLINNILLCNIKYSFINDQINYNKKLIIISFNIKTIYKKIGFKNINILKILKRIKLKYKIFNDKFYIYSPIYRIDIIILEDLIEEILKIYKYKNIPLNSPNCKINIKKNNYDYIRSLKFLMKYLGYNEVINYSFNNIKFEKKILKNDNLIKILNPISNKFNILRSSLIFGLIKVAKKNFFNNIKKLKIFEIGNTFNILKNKKNKNKFKKYNFRTNNVIQIKKLSCLSYGLISKEKYLLNSKNINFYDIKTDLEKIFFPKKIIYIKTKNNLLDINYSAKIILDNKKIGFIGVINNKIIKKYNFIYPLVVFEIILNKLLLNNLNLNKRIKYKKVTNLAIIEIDKSIIIDNNIEYYYLLNLIKKIIKNLKFKFIKDILLLDQYKDEKLKLKLKKKLTLRFLLQDKKSKLNNLKIDYIIKKIFYNISIKINIEIL